MISKPPIGSIIHFSATNLEATVIEHTERGFKYFGEPSSFIPRWNLSFTGKGEVFTDIPEWKGALNNGMFTSRDGDSDAINLIKIKYYLAVDPGIPGDDYSTWCVMRYDGQIYTVVAYGRGDTYPGDAYFTELI